MATYYVIRVPGVVPPQISVMVEKALLEKAQAMLPQAEAQIWSGPDQDAKWTRDDHFARGGDEHDNL